MNVLIIIFAILGVGIAKAALSHCPLCTIGAGAAAVGASWLGIGDGPIGIFIGAFAIALGLWIARIVKKQYIPGQKYVITALSFVTTVFPLLPMMKQYSSYYLYIMGDYGSLLNRTYSWNMFLLGAVIGGVIVIIAPLASKKITDLRGKMSPYQGLIINFAMLLLVSLVIELWL